MEEGSVSSIREATRNLVKLSRRNHKYEESDIRRSIPTSKNEETVSDVANKLKTKSSVTVEELRILKNALLDNVHNIDIVLGTHGALRGLVRELSGHNVHKQVEAAGCCCNLSLGEERSAAAVTRAAGTYLITCLDSLSTDLAVSSAWCVGNLSASSRASASLLTSQGLLSSLLRLARSRRHPELTDAALYALDHLVYQLKGDLSSDQVGEVLQAASQPPPSLASSRLASSRLLFTLSTHPSFTSGKQLDQLFIQKLLQHCTVSMTTLVQSNNTYEFSEFLYLVRVLANVCVDSPACDMVMNYFITNSFSSSLKQVFLLKIDVLNKSLYWLLGNLLRFTSDGETKNMFFNDFVVQ